MAPSSQARYLPLATCHLPLATCYYPLPTTHYPLPATHYPLPTTRYPLPTTHYPLPAPILGTLVASRGSGTVLTAGEYYPLLRLRPTTYYYLLPTTYYYLLLLTTTHYVCSLLPLLLVMRPLRLTRTLTQAPALALTQHRHHGPTAPTARSTRPPPRPRRLPPSPARRPQGAARLRPLAITPCRGRPRHESRRRCRHRHGRPG